MERADENEGSESDPGPRKELEALARLLGGRDKILTGTNGGSLDDGDLPDPVLEPDPASIAEPGDLIAGRFEVVRVSSAPRLRGVKYFARDHAQQGREIIVELVSRAAAAQHSDVDERLVELIERLRAFPHESIYPLREAGRTLDGQLFLVSDVVHGESLHLLRERSGVLPPPHALEIAHQVLSTLAQGHRRGLPHGALDEDTVVMEYRVPWTDENPHGVGARLIEFGLDDLFNQDREQPASSREDLQAVGRLLTVLITGEAHEEGATHGSLHSAAAAGAAAIGQAGTGLAPATRALIQRALAQDEKRGFADAESMLRAIEASPDWRPKKPTKGGKLGWVVAGGAALALAASIFLRPESKAAPVEEEGSSAIEAAAGTVSRQVLEEKEQALQRAANELDLLTERLSQLERDNADLSITRDALVAERDSLRERLDSVDAALSTGDGEGSESEAWREEREQLMTRLDALEGDLLAALAAEQSSVPGTLPLASELEHPLTGAALEAPLALTSESVRELALGAPEAELELALAAFRDKALPMLLSEDGAELSRARLHAIPALAAWGEVARARGVHPDLQLLELTHRYYARGSTIDVPSQADVQLALNDPAQVESASWRARLAASLLLEREPAALVGPLESRAIWRIQAPDGAVTWQALSVSLDSEPGSGVARAWSVEEATFDATGLPLGVRAFPVTQRGRRYEAIDAEWEFAVDLGSDTLTTESYAPGMLQETDTPPTVFGLSAAAVDSFRSELEERTALVGGEDGRRVWFIAGLGPVRSSDSAGSARELVFVERP